MRGMMAASLVQRLSKRQQCGRCGLHYGEQESECPHCVGLDEAGLDALQRRVRMRHEINARVGRTFLVIAAMIVIGLLVLT